MSSSKAGHFFCLIVILGILLGMSASGCNVFHETRTIQVVDEEGYPIEGAAVVPQPKSHARRSGEDGILRMRKLRESEYQVGAYQYESEWIGFPDDDGMRVILRRLNEKDD